jgi:large subunit ribosomal protein L10
LNREQKAQVIEEVAGQITESEAVFAVDYRGISVPQAAELRTKLREADAHFRVVKNTLTERAADQAGAEGLKALLEGPTAMTFVRGDAAAAAKALRDFRRASGGQLLEFKGGWMDGASVSPQEIDAIAQLPSREVLYGRLVGMVASPLTGLASALSGLIGGLARQLQQMADEGLVGGDAPAAAAPAEPAAEEPAAEAPAAEEPAAEASAAEEPAAEASAAEEPAAEEPAAEEPAAEESAAEPTTDTENTEE